MHVFCVENWALVCKPFININQVNKSILLIDNYLGHYTLSV